MRNDATNLVLLNELLQRYIKGDCSPEEKQFVESYYNYFDQEQYDPASMSSEEKQALGNAIFERLQHTTAIKSKSTTRILLRWVAAAVFLFAIAGAYWWFALKQTPTSALIVSRQNDVIPGSSKATLVLGDGTTVDLDSTQNQTIQQAATTITQLGGQLQYHVEGSKIQTGSILNTLTTPRGGQFKLTLPDGTKAYLNAASSISFPTAFTDGERKVSISGEVYFQVTASKNNPFYVIANGIQTQVLGTEFNINAYTDEPGTSITLVSGKVAVSTGEDSRVLVPGEQAAVEPSGKLSVTHSIDVEEVLAWRSGLIHFDNADLKTILRQVARWYDVEVEYKGAIPTRKFFIIMNNKSTLATFLEALQMDDIIFKLENKKLIVTAN